MKNMKREFGILQYNAPVTLTFVIVSFVVMVLHYATKGAATRLLFCTYRSSLADPLTYLRLFGHVLGHAGWSHYSSNMVLFLVLGPLLEEKYGSKGLLTMFAVTALISGLIYMLLYPNSVLLGASGIVFMMIVISSVAGMKNGKIPLTLILVVIVYLGGEISQSFGSNDGIAHLAHITGGICGAGFGFLHAKRKIS